MVRDEVKYQEAVRFRERGFTLEEIAKICAVSKSTVSKWLKNNVISAEITKKNKQKAGKENAKRLSLMSKARGKERALRYKEVEQAAEVEYQHYRKSALFIAALSLYAAVGDFKNDRVIRFSSTRIEQHKIFINFAISYLGVAKPKIKLGLLITSAHNEAVCMKKWNKITSLPYTQFHHTQILKAVPKSTPLHHGVGNTVIGSKAAKKKLLRWIELLTKDIIK